MTNYAFFPIALVSDMGSVFVSRVIKEVTKFLAITLQIATKSTRKQLELFKKHTIHSNKH